GGAPRRTNDLDPAGRGCSAGTGRRGRGAPGPSAPARGSAGSGGGAAAGVGGGGGAVAPRGGTPSPPLLLPPAPGGAAGPGGGVRPRRRRQPGPLTGRPWLPAPAPRLRGALIQTRPIQQYAWRGVACLCTSLYGSHRTMLGPTTGGLHE